MREKKNRICLICKNNFNKWRSEENVGFCSRFFRTLKKKLFWNHELRNAGFQRQSLVMKRFSFWDVFQQLPNGSLTPRRIIHINGITFGPGVSFGEGVSFGGIDFTQYRGNDISTEISQNIILIIKGVYK